MANRVTVKDLAKLCGVSIGTVDRAINNRNGINEQTRARILEAAREHGFIKDQNAVALTSGSSKLIGVIIFNLRNEYFSELLTGIESAAREAGYTTVIMLSDYNKETECSCVERLISMNVSGIIVCSVLDNPEYYASVMARGISVVAVGNRSEGVRYVGIDDRAAMYDATTYVLSRNYKRVIYLSPVLEKGEYQNIGAQGLRYKGFIDATAASDAEIIIIDRFKDYDKKLFSAISSSDSVPAVICSSDAYTIQTLSLLREANLKAGVMGFDRLRTIIALYPDLSTVAYDYDMIGNCALNLCLDKDAKNDVICSYIIIKGNTI